MAEHLLDDPEVSPSVQEVCGTRVPERVGVQIGTPRAVRAEPTVARALA